MEPIASIDLPPHVVSIRSPPVNGL